MDGAEIRHIGAAPYDWKALSPAAKRLMAQALLLAVSALVGPRLQAQAAMTQSKAEQSAAAQSGTVQSQSPSSQPLKMPDWQLAAGGKMEFDVASVKRNTADPSAQAANTNIPLGPHDLFTPTGGLLAATNFPLLEYMVFAYKLMLNQVPSVRSQLPKWASTDRYDIQARTSGNPTKDQFRLMMQALLAERFKLAVHWETRQIPVMALVLDNPRKLGPQLLPHPDDLPCSDAVPSWQGAVATVAGGFPEPCGSLLGVPASVPGRIRLGARRIPMTIMASSLSFPALSGIDRPILNRTGLSGNFDFAIEFTPLLDGSLPLGPGFHPDESGPTFLEALKEQLGLKLKPEIGPMEVLVLDHVAQPSAN